jgi:hypothetical protein
MNVFQRLGMSVFGRGLQDRVSALERTIRKLDEVERQSLSAIDRRLTELTQTVSAQPTAKDLREVRQALRGLATPRPTRWLFEALDAIASSGRPILIGPWTGEVGFELLYWIPFVRWVRAHWNLDPQREVIVSRGGVATWYGQAAAYTDIFTLITPDEFRDAIAQAKRKSRQPSTLDDRVVHTVSERQGSSVEVLHPGLMYRLFSSYWSDDAGYGLLDQFTRHELITPPAGMRPRSLPAEYVAVRFYFNECFPAAPANEAFARQVVASLAERTAVVILNPGFSVDEHIDWIPDRSGNVVTITDEARPDTNLALQSAIVAGARAFIGTYGGYSYLAPLYRVPAVAFYSKPSFKIHHLYAAQRAFAQIGAGGLMPVDVTQTRVVQLALGTLVPA